MAHGYASLTGKEKETLRLILLGHSAKSMAGELGLSVHTINERLRAARRKLEVTSTKEAARLLLEKEGDGPHFLVHKRMGEASGDAVQASEEVPAARTSLARFGGTLVMSLIAAGLGLALLLQTNTPQAARTLDQGSSTQAVETDATRAARNWLALLDHGQWDESWRQTGASFRELNTSETWTEVSLVARGPLGEVVSRELISQETVPAPPFGYEMVKFRTSFANKASVTETLSLVREDGEWRVVGIWLS
jgi:DNA-binding CsgD family transcriptional regulator